MIETENKMQTLDLEGELIRFLTNREAVSFFISDGLNENLLILNKSQTLWAFTVSYFDECGDTPTLGVLQEEFPSYSLDEFEPTCSYQWLIEKFRERYRTNEVAKVVRTTAQLVKEPEKALDYLRETVFQIDEVSRSRRYVYSADDYEIFLDKYYQEILDEKHTGSSFGFKCIDKFTGGIKPGHLGFVVARPKRFKTFIGALNTLVEQVMNGDIPMLVTLEMNEEEIYGRLGCLVSGVSFDRYIKRAVEKKEVDAMREAMDGLRSRGKFFVVRPPVGERTVASIFMEADKLGATSVIIDQLSFLEAPKDYYPRPDLKTSDIVYALKNAANKNGKERPCLVMAQLNREAASLQEMADAAKIALTDAIGQAADIIFGLHRTKEMKDSGQLQLGIIESRHSDTTDWMLDVELVKKTRFAIDESYSM